MTAPVLSGVSLAYSASPSSSSVRRCSSQSPQIRFVLGFAQAFVPHSGQVYFVLDSRFLPCARVVDVGVAPELEVLAGEE